MPTTPQQPVSPVLEALQIKRDLLSYHLAIGNEFKKEFERLEKLLGDVAKANLPKDLMAKAEAKMADATALMEEFEKENKNMVNSFHLKKQAAEKTQKEFDELAKSLDERKRALDARESEVVNQESAAAAQKATLDKRAKDLEEIRISAEGELMATRLDLQKREGDVASRERVVAEKLEKMRSLATN